MKKNIITGPEVPPISGKKPNYLCIIFHGYGADGYNLIDLCKILSKQHSDIQFLIPNAPNVCEINPEGFQWFSLGDNRLENKYNSLVSIEENLNEFIDYQLKRFNLKDEQLILMGFSQGGMITLNQALTRDKKCKAAICFSGMLLGEIDDLKTKIKSRPNIAIIHGSNDQVVTIDKFHMTKEKLDKLNIKYEEKIINLLDHSINFEALKFAMNKLKLWL